MREAAPRAATTTQRWPSQCRRQREGDPRSRQHEGDPLAWERLAPTGAILWEGSFIVVVIAVLLSALVQTQPYRRSRSSAGTNSTLSALVIVAKGIEKWCV
jgi:hypothetical protein